MLCTLKHGTSMTITYLTKGRDGFDAFITLSRRDTNIMHIEAETHGTQQTRSWTWIFENLLGFVHPRFGRQPCMLIAIDPRPYQPPSHVFLLKAHQH
jgi:hypothetical protein